MIHVIYIYLIINSLMLGSYILDRFNDDSVRQKIFCSILLFFFGAILVIFELTIADRVERWWESSELNFLWKVYVFRKYDGLLKSQIEYIEGQILAEDKNSKLYKHLKIILKRNGR